MFRVGVIATARKKNGGTLPYTISMLEALAKLGAEYRCEVITQADNREYDTLGLSVRHLPGTPSLILNRLVGREPFGAIDLLIAPVYTLKLLLAKSPFAFTLHDLQEKHYPQNFTLATRLWRDLVNRSLTARAARILCESEYVRADILSLYGVPPEHVRVLQAPIVSSLADTSHGPEQLDQIRAKYSLDQYLFYPAQFWPHKNHLRLLDAFEKIATRNPNCTLVLTGQARHQYEQVFARIAELGLQSRVRHVGHVDQAELSALYRAATAVVIPSFFESISIPIYEAFALGVPVCASNVLALPEQVGDAGLLFDPTNAGDMAEKMERLLREASLRATLIERGRERVSKVTSARYAQGLEALIGEVRLSRQSAK
jgi:glycosyltransferase involved in cell wall biosynthesis